MNAGTDAEGAHDIAALAKGGRTNFLGFLLRLAARLPFLFVAGRLYGADALGRFAYATIVVEFAGQIATLGLKRGLAQQLSKTERPHVHVVWDGLLVGALVSVIATAVLMAWPKLLFPNSAVNPLDWLLPLTIFAWAGSDIALAGLAYRGDIGATVRARSLVEPWTISIAAAALAFYSKRDGLIIAYALSAIAALAASVVPLMKSYGLPHGWAPQPRRLLTIMRRNGPLAGADAIEWGSRRLDIAILGLFFAPAIVGIYYVAQQVASLPQKLKTSFDPILGPVITRELAEGNRTAVAAQVRQVGFWIIAAQAGIALALGLPGGAVMGLVGPQFAGGAFALGVLLAAEAIAATAVVSEAALIYVAAKRNLLISIGMIVVQVLLSVALIALGRALRPDADPRTDPVVAAGPAIALLLAVGLASVVKSRFLASLLGASVSGWRWSLLPAAVAGLAVGGVAILLPEWAELALGVPAILAAFCAVIWFRGFGHEDRALFRLKPAGSAAS